MLLFNLNIDANLDRSRATNDARVITILSAEKWQGQVDRCPQPEIRLGSLAATFEQAGMRWCAGRYEIWQHGPGIQLEVTLTPMAVPSLTHNIQLGHGAHVSWCLVPRLSATGWIEGDGLRRVFEDRPAYHDHNFGRFVWGGDFSWEWGCAIPHDPAAPWTLVFARMNSRDLHRTTATSVFLLEREQHIRYFRNAEVSFATAGRTDPRPAGRIPPAAALLLPDEDCDVPRMTNIEANRGGEWLHAEILAGRRGQVLVPSEIDLRAIVRVNEADTSVRVEGECGGQRVQFEGPGLLEVVRG